MDRIVQPPGMLAAEAASAVDHNRAVIRYYIVVVAASDSRCYIASVVAAVVRRSPSAKNSGIEPDILWTEVASVLVLVRTQSRLPGLQGAGRIHSRAGTAVQAAGYSSQVRHSQTFSL